MERGGEKKACWENPSGSRVQTRIQERVFWSRLLTSPSRLIWVCLNWLRQTYSGLFVLGLSLSFISRIQIRSLDRVIGIRIQNPPLTSQAETGESKLSSHELIPVVNRHPPPPPRRKTIDSKILLRKNSPHRDGDESGRDVGVNWRLEDIQAKTASAKVREGWRT